MSSGRLVQAGIVPHLAHLIPTQLCPGLSHTCCLALDALAALLAAAATERSAQRLPELETAAMLAVTPVATLISSSISACKAWPASIQPPATPLASSVHHGSGDGELTGSVHLSAGLASCASEPGMVSSNVADALGDIHVMRQPQAQQQRLVQAQEAGGVGPSVGVPLPRDGSGSGADMLVTRTWPRARSCSPAPRAPQPQQESAECEGEAAVEGEALHTAPLPKARSLAPSPEGDHVTAVQGTACADAEQGSSEAVAATTAGGDGDASGSLRPVSGALPQPDAGIAEHGPVAAAASEEVALPPPARTTVQHPVAINAQLVGLTYRMWAAASVAATAASVAAKASESQQYLPEHLVSGVAAACKLAQRMALRYGSLAPRKLVSLGFIDSLVAGLNVSDARVQQLCLTCLHSYVHVGSHADNLLQVVRRGGLNTLFDMSVGQALASSHPRHPTTFDAAAPATLAVGLPATGARDHHLSSAAPHGLILTPEQAQDKASGLLLDMALLPDTPNKALDSGLVRRLVQVGALATWRMYTCPC